MLKFWKNFKLICTLLGILIIIGLWGDLLPTSIKSFLYAVSLTIKNLLIFFAPWIIFVFICGSLVALKKQAGKFIIHLIALVTISNFIAILVSYVASINILPLLNFKITTMSNVPQLIPTWDYNFPNIISMKITFLGSIVVGLFLSFKPKPLINNFLQKLNQYVINFFRSYFIFILPIFVLGFLCKLEYEKVLAQLLASYGPIVVLIISVQAIYTVFMYLLAAEFNMQNFGRYLKNILPASITAFSTMSSVATMPLTMICTEKNLPDKKFTNIIIPATCNIHAIGGCIGFPILALATLYSFGMELPILKNFIVFAIYFVLAKFAVAGVPGGIIVIGGQLVEKYLGFTPEMLGIITTIYLLLDTFGTAVNVTCNGAFAIIFKKIYNTT